MASLSKQANKQSELLGDAEFNKKWDLEGQYNVLRKSNDPRFGEITLLKSKSSNDLIFAKEKLVTNKQQASNDIRDLKSRMALNHSHLHKLIGYSTIVQKELCSTNYLTKAYYEFPKSDLQKEINDRRQNQSDFSHEELQNVAGQAIHGLNHLHKLEISHGDVRPLNIGYNKETREVQILDRLHDPSPLEKLQSNNIINKKDLYMSPEVYKKLQGKDKTLKYNPAKNDLYGLGLSLLAAGNQESVQNVYKPNGDFDQQNLQQHLDKFSNKYNSQNPPLVSLVHTLVQPDESQRYSAQELIDAQKSGGYHVVSHTVHTVHSAPPPQESVPVQQPIQDEQKTQLVYLGNDNQDNNANNQQVTYQYTHHEPANYSYANQTQYVTIPQQTTHFVHSAPPQDYASNTIQNPEGRLVTVHRMDGTTYSYWTKADIDSEETLQTYEQNDPRHGGGQNPEGSLDVVHQTHARNVSSIPVNTYYNQQNVVYSHPGYDQVQHQYDGQNYNPQAVSYVISNPNDGTYNQPQRVVHTSHVVQGIPAYVSGNYTNPSGVTYITSPNNSYQPVASNVVEVRRGSEVPSQTQTKSVNKKYVIEGDKVIEVENHDDE